MHCFFVSESSDGSPKHTMGRHDGCYIYSIGAIALQCCLYASLASLIGVWTRSAAIAVGSSSAILLQMIFGGSLLSTSWTHILFIHHDDLSVYWSTSQYKSELVGLLMSLAIDITYILFSLQLDYGCSSREEQTKHNTELK